MPPPASPTPEPSLELINKKPVWKVSPANGKYYVNSVAVSADGGRVVGGTFYHVYGAGESRRAPATASPAAGTSSASPDDGTFGTYCYDRTGRLLWKDEFAGWQGVYWVALSADGSRAASGGLMSASAPQGFVRAYDAQQGRMLLSRTTSKRVNQVSLSGDGTWLVSAAETLLLFRYDLATGQYVQAAEFTSPAAASIVSASISQDGATIACSDYAGWIGVLAYRDGKLAPLAQWQMPGTGKFDFCHMISLAPDGRSFAAGGVEGCFYYFDVAKFAAAPAPTFTFNTGVPGPVYGVAVATDGSRFAGVVNSGTAGQSYLLKVTPASAQLAQQDPLLRNPNSASLVVAGGTLLYAIAVGHPDQTAGYYYFFSGPADKPGVGAKIRWVYPTGNMSWPLVISASGNAVVGGSDDSFIYYFTP